MKKIFNFLIVITICFFTLGCSKEEEKNEEVVEPVKIQFEQVLKNMDELDNYSIVVNIDKVLLTENQNENVKIKYNGQFCKKNNVAYGKVNIENDLEMYHDLNNSLTFVKQEENWAALTKEENDYFDIEVYQSLIKNIKSNEQMETVDGTTKFKTVLNDEVSKKLAEAAKDITMCVYIKDNYITKCELNLSGTEENIKSHIISINYANLNKNEDITIPKKVIKNAISEA